MRFVLVAFAAFFVLAAGASGAACGADVCVGDSWQAAYAAASPGQVLTVEAGTHAGQEFARIAGRSGAPVVFQPAGGPVVVQGGIVSGKSGGSVTTATGAYGVELRDMAVTGEVTLRWGSDSWRLVNVDAGNLRFTSVSDVQVLGGDFGPWTDQVATINSAGGSSPGVSNILIDGARFHDYTISDPAKHAECMQIWPSAASSNITIRGSSFRNCTDFGVLVKAPNLTGIVFDTVTLDEPMPGNVATVGCNPNCPRSGSSIRFSTYAYPDGKVLDSRMAGSLTIDVPGNVTVSGGCTKCDPGGVTPPPLVACADGNDNDGDGKIDWPTDPGCLSASDTDEADPVVPPPTCPGTTLPLTKVAETSSTVTFGWTAVPGVFSYFFTSTAQGAKWSHTLDTTRTTVVFAKGSACYRVVALGVLADGGVAG